MDATAGSLPVTLPPRGFMGDAALVVAVFLGCAGLYGVLRAPGADQPWAYAAVSVGLVVGLALPAAWGGWVLRRRRVDVLPDRVRERAGDRVRREVVLDELLSVRVADQVSMSDLRGSKALPSVVLRSRDSGILVSRHQVETLGPLLAVLAPHVAARPGLLADDAQRETFARYVRDGA